MSHQGAKVELMPWHEQRKSMTLRDGRALAWYEFGNPAGIPCIYTTGTPGSGWGGAFFEEAAKRANVRWISVDKPGYGGSDHQPHRRLLDWPSDISQLADHLKLDRFSVAGQSGGGPHALALAYALPDRIQKAAILAGMGPVDDPSLLEGMKRGNLILFRAARYFPILLWPLMALLKPGMMKMADPDRDWDDLKRSLAHLPLSDLAALKQKEIRAIVFAAQQDAFRNGVGGAVQDLLVCIRPWGFDLSDIQVPVDIWHGVHDQNIPIAIARKVAKKIPQGTLHEVPFAGHLLAPSSFDQMMAALNRP